MRPDGTPHLYEAPMVPNLLPFSASVTTGGGSTQNAAAITQAQPGFAAMLGLGTTPVTQGSPSIAFPESPVTVSIMPPRAAPLLGLTDGAMDQPVEAALPEILTIHAPVLATDALNDIALQPDPMLVMPEAAPAAAPIEPAPPPVDPVASALPTPGKAVDPVPSPKGGTATVIHGLSKTTAPAPAAVETPVAAVNGPDKPAAPTAPTPPVKPIPAPTTDGGTVIPVDGPHKMVETTPTGGSVTVIDTPLKAADPAPVSVLQAGSVTIIEPPRKSAILAPTPALAPAAIPTPAPIQKGGADMLAEPTRKTLDSVPNPDGSTLTVIDGPLKETDPVTATPAVPTDAVPVHVLSDPSAPVIAVAIEPSASARVEDVAVPQTSPIATAPVSLSITAPVPANPAPPQPASDSASPPVVGPRPAEPNPRVEPVASGIAIDAPLDHAAFAPLVSAEPASSTDTLRTSGEAASDTMGRDGNRQTAQQPQQSAPASGPTPAGPLPAFDPLAIPSPDAARAASDSAAVEPRARAYAIGEDVGLAISRHADTGSGDVLVIRLDPAELGKIEVRLRMDEGRQLSADVTADQPATLELLRRDSDNLARALNDAGFRADDQSLRFDQRGQGDQHGQQGRRVANHAYLTEDDAAASSIPSPVQVRSSGRVDLVA